MNGWKRRKKERRFHRVLYASSLSVPHCQSVQWIHVNSESFCIATEGISLFRLNDYLQYSLQSFKWALLH